MKCFPPFYIQERQILLSFIKQFSWEIYFNQAEMKEKERFVLFYFLRGNLYILSKISKYRNRT